MSLYKSLSNKRKCFHIFSNHQHQWIPRRHAPRFYSRSTSSEYPLYEPIEMKFTHSKPENPSQTPPLLMIHGLFGNKMNFMTLSNILTKQKGIETYCVDLRNHGASPHSDEMNFIAVRNDIKLFLKQRDIEECDVFGFSLGGRAVMSTLLDESMHKYFRRAIIGDIAPVKYKKWDIPETIDKMRRLDLNVSRREELSKNLMGLGIQDQMMRDFLLSNVKGGGRNEPFQWRINLEGIYRELQQISDFPVDPEAMQYKEEEAGLRVQPYDKPLLVVRGEESKLVDPVEHTPLFHKFFPQMKMIGYEKTGHWVHFQDGQRFANDVHKFLTEEQA